MSRVDIPPKILQKFREMFPNKSTSWIRRCIARLPDVVEGKVRGVWFVRGNAKLGDAYSQYIVKYIAGKYMCSCMERERPYHSRRRKELCTHVGAVILYRLLKGEIICETGASY